MGNLYRFVEPLILLDLARHPASSGYDILQSIEGNTLTGTTIDKAAVYRTLGTLEANEMVTSEWTDSVRGAGRKAYRLTGKGLEHLDEWAQVLAELSKGLAEYGRDVKAVRKD